MAITINVRENGPLRVDSTGEEDVKVVDWNGNEYPIPNGKRPFILCRCGQSKTRPFCDLTHRAIGFQASEAAPPKP